LCDETAETLGDAVIIADVATLGDAVSIDEA